MGLASVGALTVSGVVASIDDADSVAVKAVVVIAESASLRCSVAFSLRASWLRHVCPALVDVHTVPSPLAALHITLTPEFKVIVLSAHPVTAGSATK